MQIGISVTENMLEHHCSLANFLIHTPFILKTISIIHRVKSLSKSGNPKKDQVSSSSSQLTNKESTTVIPAPSPTDADDVYEQYRDVKSTDTNRRVADKGNLSYHSTADLDRQSASVPSNNSSNIREEAGMISSNIDKEKIDVKNTFGGSISNKVPSASYSQHSVDNEEKVQKVSPPRRKAYRDEKSEKVGNWLKKDTTSSNQFTTFKPQNPGTSDKDNMVSRQPESLMDGSINDILEVGLMLRCLPANCLCFK